MGSNCDLLPKTLIRAFCEAPPAGRYGKEMLFAASAETLLCLSSPPQATPYFLAWWFANPAAQCNHLEMNSRHAHLRPVSLKITACIKPSELPNNPKPCRVCVLGPESPLSFVCLSGWLGFSRRSGRRRCSGASPSGTAAAEAKATGRRGEEGGAAAGPQERSLRRPGMSVADRLQSRPVAASRRWLCVWSPTLTSGRTCSLGCGRSVRRPRAAAQVQGRASE